jgi:hypothetical protein
LLVKHFIEVGLYANSYGTLLVLYQLTQLLFHPGTPSVNHLLMEKLLAKMIKAKHINTFFMDHIKLKIDIVTYKLYETATQTKLKYLLVAVGQKINKNG